MSVYMDVTWQNVAAVSVYPPLMIVSYVGTVSMTKAIHQFSVFILPAVPMH